MYEQPKVSVAIVTYNQLSYLKQCINSVLAQDYQNLEICIADDASTDGTREYLSELQRIYPKKIKLSLAQSNRGITMNSQAVRELCDGKYIAWTGGDDLFSPEKISKQVAYMEANEACAISFHNVEVFDSDSGKLIRYFNNDSTPRKRGIEKVVRNGALNCACATMTRNLDGVNFDVRLRNVSDWLYWVEVLIASSGEMHYIPEVLGKYRRHGESISHFINLERYQVSMRDELDASSVVMVKYPWLASDAMHRYICLVRDFRVLNNQHYENYLKASVFSSFVFKSYVFLFLYWFTFGKVKR